MGEFSTSISYCSPWYTYVSISHCYLHWIINILYKKTSKQTHEKIPLMLIFAPRIVAEMPDGAFMSLNWDINGIHIKSSKLVNFAGWWFGTWLLFFHSVGNNNPNWRTPSFFRGVGVGWNHQPGMNLIMTSQNVTSLDGECRGESSQRWLTATARMVCELFEFSQNGSPSLLRYRVSIKNIIMNYYIHII